jgi:hypothetical protein
MRFAWVGVLLGCLLPGCGPLRDHRAGVWLQQVNPFAGNAEKIIVRSYLLEQPVGEQYLSDELWTEALAPLSADQAALFAENGLRVGRITGNPPAKFLAIAHGPDVVRPQEGTVTAGEAKPVALAGPLSEVTFQTISEIGTKPGELKLKDAEIALSITPTLSETGKVKLAFEPRVQHGSRQFGWRPTTDSTAFTWLDQKVQERFPTLKAEMTLAPEEFVIIGPTAVPANTLGGAAFVSASEGRPRLRVLVVQVGRLLPGNDSPNPGRRAGVVAAQASRPLARGQSEK